MTTEDDFQRALDRRRSDWQTRLVFADWLDERSDPRGPGYRALGWLELHPLEGGFTGWTKRDNPQITRRLPMGIAYRACALPVDWFYAIPCATCYAGWWKGGNEWPRREAEDVAALAFAQLPAERQAELLNPEQSTRGQRKRKPRTRA